MIKDDIGLSEACFGIASGQWKGSERLSYGELGNIFNEFFHAWYYYNVKDNPNAQWLVQLMRSEPGFPTDEATGLVMVEEAMSETIREIVHEIARNHLAGRRLTVTLGDVNCPPGHEESKRYEHWRRFRAFQMRPISDTLTIAVIWIMENGLEDPRGSYAESTVEESLRAWYAARWSPNRPVDSRVDRLGKPLE